MFARTSRVCVCRHEQHILTTNIAIIGFSIIMFKKFIYNTRQIYEQTFHNTARRRNKQSPIWLACNRIDPSKREKKETTHTH